MLYLQLEKNCLIYSNSNKLDTQTYEFVMVSRDGSHLCYAQVKKGDVSLDGNDYIHLITGGNKVYLFTVSQQYYNVDNVNAISLDKNEIMDFIYNKKNDYATKNQNVVISNKNNKSILFLLYL